MKAIKHLQTITKHLNDFKALGMSYNDTAGYKNFFMLANFIKTIINRKHKNIYI